MPKRNDLTISKRTRRSARRRGQGCCVLGSRFAWLWDPGLCHRPKGLRCAKPGARRSEAGDTRPARRACRRSGAPEGGCCHRPYQKWPGPGSRTACARIHRGRPGGALHARAYSSELHCAHRGDLRGGLSTTISCRRWAGCRSTRSDRRRSRRCITAFVIRRVLRTGCSRSSPRCSRYPRPGVYRGRAATPAARWSSTSGVSASAF